MISDAILYHGDEKTGSILVKVSSDVPELDLSIEQPDGIKARCVIRGERAYAFIDALDDAIARGSRK